MEFVSVSIQCFRRPSKKDEHVVGKGGVVEFQGGRRTEAIRFQVDPTQVVARRFRLEGEDPAPIKEPDRIAAHRLFL